MDDIKMFAKDEKEQETDKKKKHKNVKSEYWNGIWHLNRCHAHKKKWEKKNSGKNRTAKWGKHKDAWRGLKL